MCPPRPLDDEVSTVARPKYDPASSRATSFELMIVEGPEAGTSLRLDGTQPGPLLIGQSQANDLRLTDRLVSRRHASVDVADGQVQLVDLGSTNGTFVNGVRITGALLRGGELVRLGETSIRVDLRAATSVVPLTSAAGFGRVAGASLEMRRLYPLCERLAASNVPIIIEGETGTGKELLAEAMHEMGPRSDGPFVVFDCTTVPPNLVESDLFGHERGAFTGAVGTRKGVFEQAHGGTLLIDEIGDLDLSLQPKLLRAIERAEIRRVGGDKRIVVDVRILCATRRDLDREVQAGRFRDDLFHRLAVGRIELPPLRKRRGDVPLLARNFCRELGGDPDALPDGLLARWEEHSWPGNVRELRNAVARYLALGDLARPPREGGVVEEQGRESTPDNGALERIVGMGLPFTTARQRVLEEFERRYLDLVLSRHGGNVARAAAASGIARRHLQRVKARSLK